MIYYLLAKDKDTMAPIHGDHWLLSEVTMIASLGLPIGTHSDKAGGALDKHCSQC